MIFSMLQKSAPPVKHSYIISQMYFLHASNGVLSAIKGLVDKLNLMRKMAVVF